MITYREFQIFFDQPISEQEKGNISTFLQGLSLIQQVLSQKFDCCEENGIEIENTKNQWQMLLSECCIEEYFVEGTFDWLNDQKLTNQLTDFFNRLSDNKLPEESGQLNENTPLLNPEVDDTRTPEIFDHTPDIYYRLFSHIHDKLTIIGLTISPEDFICYLIRDIASQLYEHTEPLIVVNTQTEAGLGNVVSQIRKLAFELKQNDHKPMRLTYYCQELSSLIDQIISDLNQPEDDEISSLERDTGGFESFAIEPYYKKTSFFTRIRQYIAPSKKSNNQDDDDNPLLQTAKTSLFVSVFDTTKTQMPIRLFLNFLYLHFFKKLAENTAEHIKAQLISSRRQDMNLRTIIIFLGTSDHELLKKTTCNLLEAAKEFASISPAHAFYILKEILQTIDNIPRNQQLTDYAEAAGREYIAIKQMIDNPHMNRYANSQRAQTLEFLLKHFVLQQNYQTQLSFSQPELDVLMNVFISLSKQVLSNEQNNKLFMFMSSEAANIDENMDRLMDLLDSSHLLNELTYINDHHHALHIPLNIFLLYNKGQRRLADIYGATIAYFIMLLHYAPKNHKTIEVFKNYLREINRQPFDITPAQDSRRDSFPDIKSLSREITEAIYKVLAKLLKLKKVCSPQNSAVLKYYCPIIESTIIKHRVPIHRNTNKYPTLFPTFFIQNMIKTTDYSALEHLFISKDTDAARHYFLQRTVELIKQFYKNYPTSTLDFVNMIKPTYQDIFAVYLFLKKVVIQLNKLPQELLDTLSHILTTEEFFLNAIKPGLYTADIGPEKIYKTIIAKYYQKDLCVFIQKWKERQHTLNLVQEFLQFLLINDPTPSMDYLNAAIAVLYPPLDDDGACTIIMPRMPQEPKRCYHSAPLWLSLISECSVISAVEDYIACLIRMTWNNQHNISAAGFRFLLKVVCDQERNRDNVFTHALSKSDLRQEIIKEFPQFLNATIKAKATELRHYVNDIFAVALLSNEDKDWMNHLRSNCSLYLANTLVCNSHPNLTHNQEVYIYKLQLGLKSKNYTNAWSREQATAIQNFHNKNNCHHYVEFSTTDDLSELFSTGIYYTTELVRNIPLSYKNAHHHLDTHQRANYNVNFNQYQKDAQDSILESHARIESLLLFFNRYIGGDYTDQKINKILDALAFFSMLLTQDAMLWKCNINDTNMPTCKMVRSQILDHRSTIFNDITTLLHTLGVKDLPPIPEYTSSC